MARQFGIYLHVPFCSTRCGYCDFNTYTAEDLGGGATREAYPAQAAAEIRLAAGMLRGPDGPPQVATVFVGGGTPTLLTPTELGGLLGVIRSEFGLSADAEVTTEANPESVDAAAIEQLRAVGFTRISFGMQSARAHVLGVLDRVHTPGRSAQCVAWAHQAGFEHVNLDLIYGTPGESDADWSDSLAAAVAAGPDHISAYSLIVEDGTRLAARIRRRELPAPDSDVLADRYLMAEQALSTAGFTWYEVSNWARGDAARCRHNILYWTDGDWWGIGPGAHSHRDGVRWWNVRHPRDYAQRLAALESPEAGREVLTEHQRQLEYVMLGLRLRAGLPVDRVPDADLALHRAAADGLLEPAALAGGHAVLTLRGRLLADAVVRDLTG
ncbi:MAG TPA: radical SAM family heme chaperone HemW [Sporichthyaceae bacterium]|jgi:oxygen-independent coproporphyrinogen-3 oxidase|nr:radical SAM family heme chaperone HemW [Sporichthyaceae bacterium]